MDLDVLGQRAYVYTGGKRPDTALPVVVFIHGAQQDHSCWALQSRWFAHHGFAVLVARRNLFEAELALTSTRRLLLASVVQLYKALGGGWSPDLQSAEDAKKG